MEVPGFSPGRAARAEARALHPDGGRVFRPGETRGNFAAPDVVWANMSNMDMSKPAVFHILLALAEGDSHGYAIMQTVREQSGGRVPLQTGSFYRHLTRMIDEGLVAEAPAPRQVDDPRRGTHYRLTPAGKQALERERQHLTSLVSTMNVLKKGAR
jgi:DNA-binding PadR family transcriptional regulator